MRACPEEKDLLAFGFTRVDNKLTYSRVIPEAEMCVTVILEDNALVPRVTDLSDAEEYVLYKVPSSKGEFVGMVRDRVDALLEEIYGLCKSPFVLPQTLRLMEYCKKHYSDEFEFPWSSSPKNAVVRVPHTRKWYAAILTVRKSRLGLPSEEETEIVNLHLSPEKVSRIVDNKRIFPAYHMNKVHWVSLCLDGGILDRELFPLVEESYALASRRTKA